MEFCVFVIEWAVADLYKLCDDEVEKIKREKQNKEN